MKNIYDIFTENGVEIPEDKKTAIDKAIKENYITVKEAEKIRNARDNYKEQLDTATTSLDKFKGVDVEKLNGEIEDLKTKLTNKQTEFDAAMANKDFEYLLDGAITASGAKNVKAVKALLDIDTLKASKNQAEDIKTALEGIKTDNDYMFNSAEPIKNPVKGSGGVPADKTIEEISNMSFEEYKKYRNQNN